jgi:hypothetical protein
MGCVILGLKEGKNYPIRTNDETVLDLSYLDNIMIVDLDYFLGNLGEIERTIKQITKSSNK